MNPFLLELYTDYLIASFGPTTATGLARLTEEAISHDQVTRLLASPKRTGADLWRKVKPLIREIQSPAGVLIFDDTIESNDYTDENEIVSWHWDHSKGRNLKGINLITALYENQNQSLPVSFDLVEKTEHYTDKKTGKIKRRSPTTKNERFRVMLAQCVRNEIPFSYVLADSWFASAENMRFVKLDLERAFIFPLKTNRKVALGKADKEAGRYVRVDALEIEPGTVREVYLKEVPFPLLFCKQVFTNEGGTSGVLYLVTSDTALDFDQIKTCYQRRWKVEEYHKSLKQNASLAKSPTRTETTQTNHLFASLLAFVKLEGLKVATRKNHYALKTKLYVQALKSAFAELQSLKQANSVLHPTA
ncbi:MAG TPA: transposase [Rhodothermales bacterium]|nr:transposase [Rhodothermales bacterium]